MKALTVNVQIVKNLGNYETIRLGCEWSVDDGETLESCIKAGTKELNDVFLQMYKKTDTNVNNLPELTLNHKDFKGVCDALRQERITVEGLKKYYRWGADVQKFFDNNNL